MARDSFDFVIVGSGSAGCVLANRLSADPANRVLLLEAGQPDYFWDPRVHMPAAFGFPVGSRQYDWLYESEPEPWMKGRRMAHARGKVLGGCSSINAMVYQRGNPLDFDRWATEGGASGWDYDHCLPYFKRIETSDLTPHQPYRGYSGPQRIERGPVTNPLFTAFFDAARTAGHPMTPDMNGPDNEGFAPYERTIHNGRRMSAARAYVHPVRHRKNLEVRCNALATGVVFQGSRATGVRYLPQGPVSQRRGAAERIVSAGEVILAGGAINSPQLLQLSGVGNADELTALDVPVVHHLPGVGEDLQDHLAAHVQHSCSKPVTYGILREKKNWPSIGAQWLLGHSGPGATNIFEAGGFLRSRPEMPIPDLMFGFAPVAMKFDPDMPVQIHGYQLHIGAMRLEARGHVKIKSSDPTRHPGLLYNFLSTPADRQFWLDAVRIGRELMDQPAFSEFDAGEAYPGREVQTDEQVLDWVSKGGQTGLHPTSTCRMGTDGMSVVDPASMKVHGVQGVRVVDASVMPYCPNGATHAPTMMIAERASDLILGRTTMAPEHIEHGSYVPQAPAGPSVTRPPSPKPVPQSA